MGWDGEEMGLKERTYSGNRTGGHACLACANTGRVRSGFDTSRGEG